MEPVSATAVALVGARLLGLATAAPLTSEAPARVRLAVVAAGTWALAPLAPWPPLEGGALLAATCIAFTYGLLTALAARFCLASVEIAGRLMSTSLGLYFAEQYDAQREADAGAVAQLARALGGLAFLAAGGLEAAVRAAAPTGTAGALPTTADLGSAATQVLAAGAGALADGLTLAAPLLVAAFTANVALALAHRAVAAANLFAVGFAAVLLLAGGIALASSGALVAGVQHLAARASAQLGSAAPEAP